MRNFFELGNEDYYKPTRVSNFGSNNYIEYESNGYIDTNLSIEEYFDKIKPCLIDIIIDLLKSDTLKIELKITMNFISSKDNDKEQTMNSKRDNIEVMIYENLDEIIEELFDLLLSRYQSVKKLK